MTLVLVLVLTPGALASKVRKDEWCYARLGGTYVIPGHGRLTDEADVLEYRDMLTIIRDRVQDMVKKGMTLEQVKAAKPTLDYDARYGATSGFWTTEMFIQAVYDDLRKKS